MSSTINRRTAMLGTVTLPAALAPAAALATSEIPMFGAESDPDPFVSALCRYIDAEEAYRRSFDVARGLHTDAADDYVRPFCLAADEARLAMAQTVPTTTCGLMLAISALLPVFGELKPGGGDNVFSFDDMEVVDPWTNGAGEALLRSLIAASDRILNNNEPEDV